MSWLSKTWRVVRHSKVGRWIGEALLAKAAEAVAEKVTGDDDDTRPRCSFCGAPMVPSDLAVTGWVCTRPHAPPPAA
jgi:hypothetical protein